LAALSQRLGPRALFLGGIMMAILAALVQPVEDPDFWWHLRTGRWIVEHAALPSHDLYTFTVPSHIWIDHEYLTEILMWLGYRIGGTFVVALGFGALTFAGFCLIWRTADVARRPYLIAGLGLALGGIAGGPIWGPRAQMVTFFFSCLELLWLRWYMRGSSRAIYWFPFVMALWANLHGGWAVGFAFLGVALLTEAVGWVLDREPGHLMRLRRLGLISLASAVAVGATPHGVALYLYPLKTLSSGAQQSLIVEWFSPNFHLNSMRPLELMIFLLIIAFALRRPSTYDLLLALATLGLALESVRHIALFVAATTPILIDHWSGIWNEHRRPNRLRPIATVRPWMAGVTIAGLLLIALTSGASMARGALAQNRMLAQSFPVGAANWLAAHPGVGTRMFNEYGWGGYLIFRLYPAPQRRVYIFGEAELMGDPMLLEYEDVQTVRSDWLSVLDRRRIDYVVDDRGGALTNALEATGQWRIAYQDHVSVILVRQPSKP